MSYDGQVSMSAFAILPLRRELHFGKTPRLPQLPPPGEERCLRHSLLAAERRHRQAARLLLSKDLAPLCYGMCGLAHARRSCQNPRAARRWGWLSGHILFSLIATCQRHKVEPFTYLRDVLTRIAAHPISRLPELLPTTNPPA
jgi:hypothetical protein